jgi:imidazolonepropionase-like amidohydrolase
MRLTLTIMTVLVLAGAVLAHDYAPGKAQTAPILLKGGTLYTVSDGVKENTDLLFENGRITQIAVGITPPQNAQVIDVTGKCVYPGLIAAGTQLGLIEIGAVQATDDRSELGTINPDVEAHIAYNPDSEIIPTVRSNGIAYAEITPDGSLLAGRSALLNLDAWTKEDAAERLRVGLHITWPRIGISHSWWEHRSPEEQRKAQVKARKELRQAFEDALAYKRAKDANPNLEVDSRWEAMLPVFTGELPVFVEANDYRQIEEAMHFSDEFGFRMVLVGGRDAWRAAEMLKEKNIPVIYGSEHGLPGRRFDPYDLAYATPALLSAAGVKVCLTEFGATGVRNLPFDGAHAVSYGLDKDEALRAMTLTPAEIFGVADDIGSLEVGKKATIVVSDGDIMDVLTANVTHMWIEGRQVNLDNKHKELYRKYRLKNSE